jgi:hypothetical protein
LLEQTLVGGQDDLLVAGTDHELDNGGAEVARGSLQIWHHDSTFSGTCVNLLDEASPLDDGGLDAFQPGRLAIILINALVSSDVWHRLHLRVARIVDDDPSFRHVAVELVCSYDSVVVVSRRRMRRKLLNVQKRVDPLNDIIDVETAANGLDDAVRYNIAAYRLLSQPSGWSVRRV